MKEHDDLLAALKRERRWAVDEITEDLKPWDVQLVASIHIAIQALEAVMAEPSKTGPKIEYGTDGYPK